MTKAQSRLLGGDQALVKVVMCAYACNPEGGSEPAIGWNWVEQASRNHEVWVITRDNDRGAVEAELARNPNPNLHFSFHAAPKWMGNPQRLPTYLAWHLTAVSKVKRLNREHHFDLAHHVTYGAFRYPTLFAWTGIPFIVGPISGAERAPTSFLRSFGIRSAMTEIIRNVTSALVWAIPLTRATLKRASMILVVTGKTQRLLPTWAQGKTRLELACGVSASEATEHRDNFDVPRILMTGRMIYWKGFPYGLRAFAEFHKQFPKARLSICGDGPQSAMLEKLCDDLGIRASVDFLYKYSHQQALDQYAVHSVFLSPTLHFNGIAVLEAMNAGMPVVEMQYGEEIPEVTEETGIRVPLETPEQVVRDLAAALTRLASDPALARKMGLEGQRRIREVFDWDLKASAIDKIYRDVAGVPETTQAPVRTSSR